MQKSKNFIYPDIVAAGLPLFFFFVAFAFTFGKFPGAVGEYSFLTSVSAVSTSALFLVLARSKCASPASLLAISIILVFGYFKFYWILFDSVAVLQFFPVEAWPAFKDSGILLNSFSLLTLGFLIMALASISCCYWQEKLLPKFVQNVSAAQEHDSLVSRGLLAVLLILLPVSSYLIWKCRIGIQSMPAEPLPMRLSGIIYYFHSMMIPGLILTQIAHATRAGKTWLPRAGICLLIVWAISDAAIRGSRGTLFLAPLMLFFLSVTGGLRFRKAEVIAIVSLVFLAILVVPIVAQYRFLRAVDGLGVWQAFSIMSANISMKGQVIFQSMVFIFFRIPGMETLIAVVGMDAAPLGLRAFDVLTSSGGLDGYLTRDIFHVKFVTSYAPSFIAGAYLLGGASLIAVVSAIAAVVVSFGWRFVLTCGIKNTSMAGVFFLLLVFWGMTEGFTSIFFKQIIVACVVVVLLELILRLNIRSSTATRRSMG